MHPIITGCVILGEDTGNERETLRQLNKCSSNCVCVCFHLLKMYSSLFSFTLSLALPHTQGGIIDNHRVWGHGTGNQGCLGNGALLIKWSSSLSTWLRGGQGFPTLSPLLFCVHVSFPLSSSSKSPPGVCHSHTGNFDIFLCFCLYMILCIIAI